MGLGQKFKHMELLCFIRRFQGTFFHSKNRTSQGTFFNNNRNILVIKCEKHKRPKIVGKFLSGKTRSEYLKQTERLSTNVKPFSTFRNFQAIFAPSNSYFTEKSRWLPLRRIPRTVFLLFSQNKKSKGTINKNKVQMRSSIEGILLENCNDACRVV